MPLFDWNALGFLDLDDAREKVEEWRTEYNTASQHPSVYVVEKNKFC